MKKTLLSIFATLLLFPMLSAQNQEGLFSLGADISYGSEIKSIGLGGRAQYGFTDHIRGSIGYKYYIDRRDWSEWEINMDAHYLLEASEVVSFYPIVGLKFSRWTVDTSRSSGTPKEDSYKSSTNRLGLNLGLGGQVQLSYNVFLQIEPKYEITKHYSQFVALVGLVYQF